MNPIDRIAFRHPFRHPRRHSWVLAAISIAGTAMAAEPAAPPASRDAMPAVTSPASVPKANDAAALKETKPASAAQPARRPGSDRLDLDTSVVTGNRELPKVLYIVPWKRSDLGDLPPQPLNTLLDEVLTPVDRDVFRREVTYYGAMSAPEGTTNVAPASSGAASEK